MVPTLLQVVEYRVFPIIHLVLLFIEKQEAYFSQVNYLAGIKHGVLTYGTRIGPSDFIGLHLFYLDSGPMEETTELFPDGTGANFNVFSLAARSNLR